MEQCLMVLRIIAPIFAAVFIGAAARKNNIMTAQQLGGLQQFAVKFGLPCVLFNSCFTANITAESVTSMLLVLPLLFVSSAWAFSVRRKKYRYHNLPMMFSAQESGMLGIPLFIALFGAQHAYRIGMLDLAQSFIAIPVIAVLTSDSGKNSSIKEIAGKVFRSPLLLMSLLGLALNLSGAAAWLNSAGWGEVISQTAGFISQPVSASMLFSVGYNFSISKGNRKIIFRIAALHFALFMLFCGVMQAALLLIPDVDPMTRWAVLIYGILPPSYLSPSMGRNEEEYTVASGVCSILTVVTLALFCVITGLCLR
ncbi:MAG: AEC family transporter [Oscillospiraceae bacterium]|nr:AEC family transporter [Oscillospiraceae bacterium]